MKSAFYTKIISQTTAICFVMMLLVSAAVAVPLDLNGFSADPGVTESGGTITFVEDIVYGSMYYYNNSYVVPDDAAVLSFSYDITWGLDDLFDYLTFDAYVASTYEFIDYVEFPDIDGLFPQNETGTLPGTYAIDLTPYRGMEISLAWGFIEGDWDGLADSTATIFNIDLAQAQTPIPEPGTITLLGAGMVGLCAFYRKRKQLHTS